MLFGKLLEAQDGEENDLTEMEQELRQGLERVKAMATGCRISGEEEAGFETNSAGVSGAVGRTWCTPTSRRR